MSALVLALLIGALFLAVLLGAALCAPRWR